MDIIIYPRRGIAMIKKYFWFWLLTIALIGGFLRVIYLNNVPPHLGNDEISIAYDSYSIRTTGKDEYGISWPLSFKSHRVYKSPLYAYLNMPFNYLFGNNEYGVRFLSAFVGSIAIIILGLFGRFLGGSGVGLFGALLLAINPKSIFVSRMAYESNLASVMMLIGVFLMFKFLKKQKKIFLFFSGFFLGLSVWSYQTQLGLVPLLMFGLPFLWNKKINFKKWGLMWVVAIILIIPIVWDLLNVQMKDPYNRASSQIWYQGVSLQTYLSTTNDNKIKKTVTVLIDPIYRYLDHFSLDYLFTKGMELFPKNEPFNFGWFLLGTLPLLIVGLVNIKKIYKEYSLGLLFWWLLCPIIPSLTHGEIAAVRNLAFIMPTILIMSAGGKIIFDKSKKYFYLIMLIILLNFTYFSIAYYVHFPKISGDDFQYGYKQAWLYIKPLVNTYDKIVIEPKFGSYGQFAGLPRLYWGYFGAFNSQEMLSRDSKLSKIGKYWIRDVDWNQEKIEPGCLYVVSASNPIINEKEFELLTKIINTNGKPQFYIYKTKQNETMIN